MPVWIPFVTTLHATAVLKVITSGYSLTNICVHVYVWVYIF